MKNLKILNVSFNKLKIVPLNIIGLENLEQCNFENNRIDSVHDNLFSLKYLKILNLKRNNLEFIPRSISGLQSLEYLDLSFNHISTIEIAICRLNSLINLSIDHNPITFPPNEICSLGLNAIKGFLTNLTGSHEITSNPSSKELKSSYNFLNCDLINNGGLKSDSVKTLANFDKTLEKRDQSKLIKFLRDFIQIKLCLSISAHVDFFTYISDGVCLCKLVKKYDKSNQDGIFVSNSRTSSLDAKQKLYNVSKFVEYCKKHFPLSFKICAVDQILAGKYNEDIIHTILYFLQINGEKIQ
ncbi:hypothetical protein MXB_1342 [Myxobolus squamalis]|nr:hypothetical protein MXB_1342 [Myxobolus squamalis]